MNPGSYGSLRRNLLVLIGIGLIGFNLRPVITTIPPILELIRADLNLSYAMVSLLTTIPILFMGVFSLQGTRMSEWLGQERAIFWSVVVLAAATGLRFRGDIVWILMGSTVMAGVAIAIIQTLIAGVIKKFFADRAALVMGLYTSAIIVGAAFSSGITAPLTDFLGHWTRSLGIWGAFVLPAIGLWIPVVLRSKANQSPGGEPVESGKGIPWSRLGAWWITLLFACQSIIFSATLTWIAPLYVSLGWSDVMAGYVLSVSLWVSLLGSLIVPTLADRFEDRRPWLYGTVMCVWVGLLGMTLIPEVFPWGWAALFGFGLGAQFPLSLTLPLDYSTEPDMANRLTGMTYFIGYSAGALGPITIGIMLDLGVGYTEAFLGLFGLSLIMGGITTRFQPGTLEELSGKKR